MAGITGKRFFLSVHPDDKKPGLSVHYDFPIPGHRRQLSLFLQTELFHQRRVGGAFLQQISSQRIA
ncbi:MAG: hypothetical protein Q7R45_00255, partial [Sulfuricaulis sp.]|nr:hypothetical protein [Sulfuricaulis sp.]